MSYGYQTTADNHGSGSRVGVAVTTVANGDVLVAYIFNDSPGYGAPQAVTGVSDSAREVTTWTKLVGIVGSGTTSSGTEIWWGVITSLGGGPTTVTATFAGAVADWAIIRVTEFSSTEGSGWQPDTSASQLLAGTVTSGAFPSVTPSNADGLYIGAAASYNALTVSGATATGYGAPHLSSTSLYDLAPGSGAFAPTWTKTSDSVDDTQVAGFLTTGVIPHGFIPNRIYTQAVRRSYTWFKDVVFDRTPRGLLVPKVA